MREMRDSGVAWIGKIPKEWGIVKFKYLHNGLNTGEAIDKEYWESDAGLNAFYTAGLTPIRTGYSNFPTWKETGENDLLLARNGTPYVYLPVSKAYYTDHIIRAAMSSLVNRRFIRYCLQQSIASIAVDSVSIPTWSATLWNNQILTWPSVIEQERIAAFLDAECAGIDAVLEKTRASIEEYKKLKQAVITQAVTKGIRGDRPMKDSGIEWIGEIPVEWRKTQLRHCAAIKSGITLGKKYEKTDSLVERPYLRVANVQDGYVDLSVLTTIKVTQDEDLKYRLHAGDVLMTEGGDRDKLGRGCVWHGEIEPCLHQNHIFAVQTSKDTLLPEFLEYLTVSDVGRSYFDVTAIKTTNLACTSSSKVLAFTIPLPSVEEQAEIVEVLNTKCAGIDALIAKKQQYLTEIENYKKSLIYEYVTGKKEVRPL